MNRIEGELANEIQKLGDSIRSDLLAVSGVSVKEMKLDSDQDAEDLLQLKLRIQIFDVYMNPLQWWTTRSEL